MEVPPPLGGELLQTHSKQTTFEKPASEKADSILKLERMRLPSFDGDIHDYPRFKSDFQRQVLPGLEKPQTAAYVLKFCLSKSPFDIIRNVDDNLDEMWKRL